MVIFSNAVRRTVIAQQHRNYPSVFQPILLFQQQQSGRGGQRHRKQQRCSIHSGISHLSPLTPSTPGKDGTTESNDGDSNRNNDTKEGDKVPVQTFHKSPIVQKLWKTRDEAKRRVMGNLTIGDGEYSDVSIAAAAVLSDCKDGDGKIGDCVDGRKGKAPRESRVGIAYPFSSDEFLKETYRNPWGEMRFGKILEDLDALAGNIAFNHVHGNPLIVTAGVDRIRIRQRPIIGQDQYLSGKVTWVGSSSMEIRMQISTREDGSEEWLEAYFTFVTLDPETKKAMKVTPLLPETNEERAHFELGAIKAQNKKMARKNKIEVGRPLSEESLKIDIRAGKLLEEAGQLLRMPSLADPNTILMDQTLQSNAMVAQPQARNLHDRIFGGFLMRRAFELAFATAYMFGGGRPRFLKVSNHFYFTFALPEKKSCRRVLPGNIDQARRQATRMHADDVQSGLRP